MAWTNRALETYERNADRIVQSSHLVIKTQLEITITQDGEFYAATKVDPQNCRTIMPVTEESANRTSGVAPHPLGDSLGYVAADFGEYSQKDCSNRFELYQKGLETWLGSEYAHPKVKAVYDYISKGKIMRDLIDCGEIELDSDGYVDKVKIQGIPCEKAIVRFRVLNPKDSGATWEDTELMRSFTSFYMSTRISDASTSDKIDLCYITGERGVVTNNHPKGILGSNYSAKLITANDAQNFTYRGRFAEPSDVCSISYDASQKIHAALSWLTRRQGIFIGIKNTRVFICWTPDGKSIREFNESIFVRYRNEDSKPDPSIRTEMCSIDSLEADENVSIMGLEAATTGRLSITYHKELKGSELARRLQHWQETFNWFFVSDKTGIAILEVPTMVEIATAAFGKERGHFLEVDEKILKPQVERLIACMIQGTPLPYDIVRALFENASLPIKYNERNQENILFIACAAIAKYYSDKGVKFEQVLDKEITNRDYLFGRLFAVYKQLERRAVTHKNGMISSLQASFVSNPMRTWIKLEIEATIYYPSMPKSTIRAYKNIISQIVRLLVATCKPEDLDKPLSELYLLGYSLQRRQLNKAQKEIKNERLRKQD